MGRFEGMKQARFTNAQSLFLLMLILLLMGSRVEAQLYVGVGTQVGYMNVDNADRAVDFFNDKGFLFRQQNKFHWPWGFHYYAAYREDGLLLELGLNSKAARTRHEIAEASGIYREESRFTIHALQATAGYAVVDQSDFQLYLAGGIDLGYMRLIARQGAEANINRANFATYRRTSFVGTTLSVRFLFRGEEESLTSWTIAPYVQIPFQEFDFREFNVLLNTLDWQELGTSLPDRPVNFGLLLTFDLDLLTFLE